MKIAPVAYRYAKSLLALALEKGKLEEVHQDMRSVAATSLGSSDLRVMLKSPVVRDDRKVAVLNRVFKEEVGDVVMAFMNVLVRKGRGALLPDVAVAFGETYLRHKDIVICKVITAVPLTEEERKNVKVIAAARFPEKTIQLEELVDPSLIGGGIIQVGDLQWDASVRNKLHVIRRTFAENPYVAKIG